MAFQKSEWKPATRVVRTYGRASSSPRRQREGSTPSSFARERDSNVGLLSGRARGRPRRLVDQGSRPCALTDVDPHVKAVLAKVFDVAGGECDLVRLAARDRGGEQPAHWRGRRRVPAAAAVVEAERVCAFGRVCPPRGIDFIALRGVVSAAAIDVRACQDEIRTRDCLYAFTIGSG